ncbi:MAG: Hsp20 family protein [Nanoarchaeota archaeon]|nr:Hsp20 family protein [Nanoarchaeota archaeon]
MDISRVSPDVCSYVDERYEKLNIEVVLPGVSKKDINLRMVNDAMHIDAVRGDKRIKYVSSLSFCCPVNPEKADAKYENGLLKISVPFSDPMEEAKRVIVS